MQQVGARAILANARMVDPRALPVSIRPQRRRPLINLSHVWVLHRRGIIRLAAASIMCVAVGGVYMLRQHIALSVSTVSDAAQGEFARVGFAIGQISITGQTLTGEQAIFDALGIEPKTSTLNFDAEAARERVAALPAIAGVSIRKSYPGTVTVLVTEKTAVARWRVDGVTFLVDAQGEQIGDAHRGYGELPLIIGDGAADDAQVMIRALNQHPLLARGIVALSRIADRRWDMIYDTGLRVQLPEQGVAQALNRLESYQDDYKLLDRDVTIIDLRVPEVVAVRPAKHDDEPKKKP